MTGLNAIMQECIKELKSINIPVREVEDIAYVRMRGDFARCLLDVSGHYHIRIADSFQRGKYDSIELKSTICHELLHTCEGCGNHDELWRSYAKRVDSVYPYEIMQWKTSYDACHKEKPVLHQLKCKNCGSIWNIKDKKAWNEYEESIQDGEEMTCSWCECAYETIF